MWESCDIFDALYSEIINFTGYTMLSNLLVNIKDIMRSNGKIKENRDFSKRGFSVECLLVISVLYFSRVFPGFL